MRRRGLLAGIALVFGTLFVTVHHARAQDEPFPVERRVGETFEVCTSGQIVCPARTPICDDPKVAVPVEVQGGAGLPGCRSRDDPLLGGLRGRTAPRLPNHRALNRSRRRAWDRRTIT